METIQKATELGIAVPGSLGIILAIATFIFMVWLVRFVMTTNKMREDKYMELIQKELAQQQAALGRIEEAGRFQRAEHQEMAENQIQCMQRHDAAMLILERIAGMLAMNPKPQKHNSP